MKQSEHRSYSLSRKRSKAIGLKPPIHIVQVHVSFFCLLHETVVVDMFQSKISYVIILTKMTVILQVLEILSKKLVLNSFDP